MNTDTVVIDLSMFGGEGFIEVGLPTLRKEMEADAKATALLTKFTKEGEPIITSENGVYADMIRRFAYLRSAPFNTSDVESFFEYTDKLDLKCSGSGKRLLNEINSAIEKVCGGETSPSLESQEAGTGTSE